MGLKIRKQGGRIGIFFHSHFVIYLVWEVDNIGRKTPQLHCTQVYPVSLNDDPGNQKEKEL